MPTSILCGIQEKLLGILRHSLHSCFFSPFWAALIEPSQHSNFIHVTWLQHSFFNWIFYGEGTFAIQGYVLNSVRVALSLKIILVLGKPRTKWIWLPCHLSQSRDIPLVVKNVSQVSIWHSDNAIFSIFTFCAGILSNFGNMSLSSGDKKKHHPL